MVSTDGLVWMISLVTDFSRTSVFFSFFTSVVGVTTGAAVVVVTTIAGAAVVVGATVVGATVVGATVVGATVVVTSGFLHSSRSFLRSRSLQYGTVVSVAGALVVGTTVVGATVVGATVVGATVVCGALVVVGAFVVVTTGLGGGVHSSSSHAAAVPTARAVTATQEPAIANKRNVLLNDGVI